MRGVVPSFNNHLLSPYLGKTFIAAGSEDAVQDEEEENLLLSWSF
jgi:hypothetical protein